MKEFKFNYARWDDIEKMSESDRQLIAAAREATATAYAPYSHFNVGAAALLKSGRIIKGSNQESEVFPAGLCAERTLLFAHGANEPDDHIVALAIASSPSERECYPCGQCRQVIVDVQKRQGSPIKVIMSSGQSATVVDNAQYLLPFTFEL